MPGVHGLQHIDAFRPSHLSYHDAVGPHAQGVCYQVSYRHLTLPLYRCRTGLEPHHMRVPRELELRGILNRHDALTYGNLA